MLQVEQTRCSELAAELRGLHPREWSFRKEQVGLALSGGGTRAAAFHCGVLWSLADAGVLKDVSHLAATSGGGYTASSLMTHLYQMSAEAESSPSLDAWYQKVVARMVLRMQANINFLVSTTRDKLFRLPDAQKGEEVGTSLLPRIFDLPLLLMSLFFVLVITPIMTVAQTMWPVVLHLELWYGQALRSDWCNPHRAPQYSSIHHAWVGSRLKVTAILAACAFTLFYFFNGRGRSTRVYLVCRSLRQVLERCTVAYALYTLIVMAVLVFQVAEWGSADDILVAKEEKMWVRALCHRYVLAAADRASGPTCSDYRPAGGFWFQDGGSSLYLNDSWVSHNVAIPSGVSVDRAEPVASGSSNLEYVGAELASLGVAGVTFLVIGIFVLGGTLVKWFMTLSLPIGYLMLIVGVARWMVFGPLTGQSLFSSGAFHYTPSLSTGMVQICLVFAVVTLPFYDIVQKLTHYYYRRALRQAYFHGGDDVSVAALATCPYCPYLVFGTCLHDYRKPENEDNFCDFLITPLFLGSERTGYYYTPSRERLAHLLTVTGAATDAALLTGSDNYLVRVLLAVVSLRLGDFLRLQPSGQTAVNASRKIRAALKKSSTWMPRLKKHIEQEEETTCITVWLQGLLDRLPSASPFLVCDLLLLAGAFSQECSVHRWLIASSCTAFMCVLSLSYFAHLRPLQFLVRSPMVQQFLMLTMHRYKAPSPPPYVYISDGGLLEVLGVLPLLRRRLPVIIVSDAGHDPQLSMRCLRDAAACARRERICSIFDPRDPRRDLEYILQDLPAGNDGFLHLGIRYESSEDGQAQPSLGELFYVRMRLPHNDTSPARQLLTEEELLATPKPASSAPVGDGSLRKDLGGVCCECGDSVPGEQFPNFGMGNQFLTPLHFANLCGLGAELAQPMVEALRSRIKGSSFL